MTPCKYPELNVRIEENQDFVKLYEEVDDDCEVIWVEHQWSEHQNLRAEYKNKGHLGFHGMIGFPDDKNELYLCNNCRTFVNINKYVHGLKCCSKCVEDVIGSY